MLKGPQWILAVAMLVLMGGGAYAILKTKPTPAATMGMADREFAKVLASRNIPPLMQMAFLAVPEGASKRELGENEQIPAIGQYVASLDDFRVSPIDETAAPRPVAPDGLWISPQFASVRVPPKAQWAGPAASFELSRSLSISADANLRVLGGEANTSSAVRKQISFKFSDTRQMRLNPSNMDYYAELARVYTGKQSRVYFVKDAYVADVSSSDKDVAETKSSIQKGGSDQPAGGSASGQSHNSSKFSGRGVLLGCTFHRLLSSINTAVLGAGQQSNQTAAAFEQILGVDSVRASSLATDPVMVDVGPADAKVVFDSPFTDGTQSLRHADNPESPPVESSSTRITKGELHDLIYSTMAGNRFYSVRVKIRIDGSEVRRLAPEYAAAAWQPFDPIFEYIARQNETVAKKIERAHELSIELAKDAMLAAATPSDVRPAQIALLKTSAPCTELKSVVAEVRALPGTLAEADAVEVALAEAVLQFVGNDTPPDAALLEALEARAQKSGDALAVGRWMAAQVANARAREPAEFVAVMEQFEKAAKAAQSSELKRRLLNIAIAAHITAATALAAEAEKAPLPQIYILPIEKIRRKGLLLVASGDVVSPRLGWEGNGNSDSVPSPWVKTSYRTGAGVRAGVVTASDGTKTCRVEANRGSIQINSLVNIPLDQFKYVSWDWKAIKFPARGNCMDPTTDDQPIQVVLVFLMGDNSVRALDYGWDSNAPVHSVVRNRPVGYGDFAFPLSYLVVESGAAGAPQWKPVRRDIAADWAMVFPGIPMPPVVAAVTVQSNGQYTGADVAGEVGEIVFSREPLGEARVLHGRD